MQKNVFQAYETKQSSDYMIFHSCKILRFRKNYLRFDKERSVLKGKELKRKELLKNEK